MVEKQVRFETSGSAVNSRLTALSELIPLARYEIVSDASKPNSGFLRVDIPLEFVDLKIDSLLEEPGD